LVRPNYFGGFQTSPGWNLGGRILRENFGLTWFPTYLRPPFPYVRRFPLPIRNFTGGQGGRGVEGLQIGMDFTKFEPRNKPPFFPPQRNWFSSFFTSLLPGKLKPLVFPI